MKEGDKARPFVKQGTFLFAIFSISMILYEYCHTTKYLVDCCYWIKFLIFNLYVRLHNSSMFIKFQLILIKDKHNF